MKENGLLLILSGPSGVGKGTVVDELIRRNENITVSVSMTTRAPRAGEVEGESYYFVTREDFLSRMAKGELLEHSNHFENYYGTPKAPVSQAMSSGKDVILEIDVNGAFAVKEKMPDSVLIMIAPPSLSDLRDRLKGRNTETAEVIEERIGRAKFELGKAHRYDYVVINDDIEEATIAVETIIAAERLKTSRRRALICNLLEDTKND
ncbi:MAG: guanylate kinase [Clostridia bacterium]|jgi:guanylate kinase|nr:guanylate kinase [Clostridia bacterium]